MTHKPPVPGQSVSPYPLKAEQLADRDAARHKLTETIVTPAEAAPAAAGPRVVVAAAIGSAAIAAALLFWNRSRSA